MEISAALRRWAPTVLLIFIALLGACHGDDGARRFDIRRQSATEGLNEFARQANITLLFPFDLVAQIDTHELHGDYSVDKGLHLLLDGTGLDFQQVGPTTYTICEHARCAAVDVAGKP